jgi:hypothetical protein
MSSCKEGKAKIRDNEQNKEEIKRLNWINKINKIKKYNIKPTNNKIVAEK